MIDNIVLVITGAHHDRDAEELKEKCHPLGLFDSLPMLCVCTNASDLYRMVLVDTPLGMTARMSNCCASAVRCLTPLNHSGAYFGDLISLEDLDEMNIEIIRNTLYKAYLEDFYQFCCSVGGSTKQVMCGILELEADRRAINITVNSVDTDLDLKEREKLYPTIGLLYPEATSRLAKAIDLDTVRTAIDAFPVLILRRTTSCIAPREH